jgi:hypothetical protein
LVAAAVSQSGSAVASTFVDLKGFRFESIRKHDDPMFVPGSVKYLDVDGLLSLCAPARLTVVGRAESKIARSVYDAADATDRLSYLKPDQDDLATSIVRSLAGELAK